MRILALDMGEKNIGLAKSDELGWTAQGAPNLVRKTKDKDISAIANLVKENSISEIIVGMPINLDGSLSRGAKEIANFIEDLKKKVSCPVKCWDERLTSVQAERVLLEADLSRKKRRKKIDMLAAQLILQSYLDAKSGA